MNFFQTVFELCSGISVYPRLMGVPIWRALLHLVLIALICAFAVTAAAVAVNKSPILRMTDAFFEKTGEISLTPDAVSLAVDPNVSRSYTLNILRFDYFASPADLSLVRFKDWKASFGIFCMKTGIAFWARDFDTRESGRYRLVILPAAELYSVFSGLTLPADALDRISAGRKTSYTEPALVEEVRAGLSLPESAGAMQKEARPFVLEPDTVSSQILFCLGIFTFFFFLVEEAMLLALAVIFFSLAELFRANALAGPKKLKYREILAATIYTTFPPLLVASIFSACQIEFLSFQTVFFISYFVYQLFVFNSIFRKMNPPPPADNYDDDSDF